MSNPVGELILDGNLLLVIPVALLAGLVSFASPCVLPLVPGYLGYIGGFTNGEDKGSTKRLVLGVSLFILGFTVVFVAFTVLFGTAGFLLRPWLDLITRIAGAIVIVMGLVFIGQVTFAQRTIRPRMKVATGLAGAPFLGIVFALGWTPCVGPTLIAVGSMVLDGGDPGRAAIVGVAYSLGLGIPFLLVALGLNWATNSVAWMRRHIRIINLIGGAMLVLVGLLMVTGVWRAIVTSLGAVIGGFDTIL